MRRFFAFCRPEDRQRFGRSIFIGIVTSMMGALRIPALGITVQDTLAGKLSFKTLGIAVGIMLFSLIVTVLSKMYTTMLQTEGGYGTCSFKRIEIAKHMRCLPMGYYNANSLGKITAVTTATMDALASIATRVVMLVTQGIMTAMMITVSILFYSPYIAAICAGGIVLFLLMNAHMIKVSGRVADSKQKAMETLTEAVLSYIQGIMEVKNYNLVGASLNMLGDAIDQKQQADFSERHILPSLCLQKMIVKLTGVAVCMAAIFLYLNGNMNLAYVIVFLAASFMLYETLDAVGTYSALLRSVEQAMTQTEEILQAEGMNTEGKEMALENYDIELKHVSFSYGKEPVIQDVSVKIPEHTLTAIVGPSGSGKTTLAKLISRFWDVDRGEITLGGENIKAFSYHALIQNFSFVFQNVYLFEDTLANNIRFGMADASMEQVIAAAKKACCHDFILSLPDGYDTVCREGGSNLSGGEKQRISIARAIMKDAPVIILDEATANIDPENEAELTKAVEELTKNKTVIMIAHRLKTVKNADCILVLDSGRIVQQGTHEQLLKEDGIYRRFVESRTKAIGWKITKPEVQHEICNT